MGRLLKQQGYTLQRTRKTLEGAQHQDRDGQFHYLNEQARAHLAAGQPVTSVDTKKKELVGNFAGGGAEWQPVGEPVETGVHDFPDPALGKAIPYGVYDLGANTDMASGITASSQGCIARRERNAVVLGPRSLPAVAGLC